MNINASGKDCERTQHVCAAPTSWPRRLFSSRLVICIGLCLLYLAPSSWKEDLVHRWSNETDTSGTQFSWERTIPSKQLRYTSCFGAFQCARLIVPLNWNATDSDKHHTAAIAIVRLPAKVPITDPRYGGAIITNPGGPGESGVHQLLSSGEHLQVLADAARSNQTTGKFFDMISFDPRGVNNTTPHLKCFANAQVELEYLARMTDYGLLWSSSNVLGLEWGQAQALGESCSRRDPTTGLDTIRYINTAQTVQDMVEIIERHGEWRETEARRLLALSTKPTSSNIPKRLQWKQGLEKIQYWGLSYGTTLGQTFAAMHPHRIHRMILDGVMDAADYYAGTWLANLVDSDKIITAYATYCFQAGAEKCPLYKNTSAQAIEAHFEAVMMDLKLNPIPLIGGGDSGPDILTYHDMHLRLLGAMYSSYAYAEDLFRLVAGIAERNSTIIAEAILRGGHAPRPSKRCIKDGPFSDACVSDVYISGLGPVQAIACMDSAWNEAADLSKRQFEVYLEKLQNLSKWISPSWARNKLACVGYPQEPAWAFRGPISATPAYPILAIGNTHDSVCPLRNAAAITHLFPTSILLHQDAQGHCFSASPSTCTGRAIRAYFQHGTLPVNGTVCTPEYRPFSGCARRGDDGECVRLGEEDEGIFRAIEALV